MRKFGQIWTFLKEHKFALLLLSLLMQTLLPVFFVSEVMYNIVNYLCVSFTLVVSIVIFYRAHKPKLIITFVLLVFTAVFINWLDYFGNNQTGIRVYRVFLLASVYIVIFLNIFKEFKRRGKVSLDFIFGAISGYLLIGIMGAFLSFLINFYYPGSFSFIDGATDFRDFIYFSFVTITTLGYGDALPVSHQGEVLAIFLAIVGQLYLTISMALIIGKYLMSADKEN